MSKIKDNQKPSIYTEIKVFSCKIKFKCPTYFFAGCERTNSDLKCDQISRCFLF